MLRCSGVALVALAGSLSAQATRPDPSRIERGLRTLVRVAGREDSTFDIRDRMRQYHMPPSSGTPPRGRSRR